MPKKRIGHIITLHPPNPNYNYYLICKTEWVKSKRIFYQLPWLINCALTSDSLSIWIITVPKAEDPGVGGGQGAQHPVEKEEQTGDYQRLFSTKSEKKKKVRVVCNHLAKLHFIFVKLRYLLNLFVPIFYEFIVQTTF